MNESYEYLPDNVPMPPPGMPGQKSDEIFSAIMQEKRVETILEQLNPERLIVEIEFRLKGWKKNQFTRKWELIGKKEVPISDDLLVDMLSIASSVLTNNTSISNYTPDEINKLMRHLGRTIIDMMREKAHIYQIFGGYAERDRILWIMGSSIFSTFKRALGGLESKRTFDSTLIRDQYQPPQQKGALAKLFNI